MTDVNSIFLDLEEAIDDLVIEQSLDEERTLKLNKYCTLMKRDCSNDNLEKQSILLQNMVDKMVYDWGATPSLLLLQARLQQLRVLFDIRDSFNTEE